MKEYESTGNYYLISHLTLISGLSDRTIRSHIAKGILQGERINGLWHFTQDQVDAFLRHPTVIPSLQAKQNAIVNDFMHEQKKAVEEACLILDLPGRDAKATGEFFYYSINNGGYQNVHIAYDHTCGIPRVILRGPYQDIHKLIQAYYDNIAE